MQWYKNAVIYQIHVKCFYDGNNDGIGDFIGLTQKLDYIQKLGITAIWLQPFYPSPLLDDGYDIADYRNINPQYGTLHDFKTFLHEAHKRGLRVITELVINHTSDQHEWFQKSRRAEPGSKWREFYVWNDSPKLYEDARIIFKDFEVSNWSWDPVAQAYYWHRFYSHQPDLNYDNLEVHEEIFKLMDYWFEMGVDGMRLDAIPYLYERDGTDCENLPETHAFLKKLRAHVDSKFDDKMLLAEANQWPEEACAYFGDGDECHMAFHFPVMPRLFMALRMEDWFSIQDILEQTPEIPESCQWAMFLRNHDELTLEMVTDEERDFMYSAYAKDPQARINLGIRRRLAPLLDNDRAKIQLMNILLFSLPGSPIIYYGDEIGMGDNYYLGDRDGVRTPMQWSTQMNAGFSQANPQKLYLPLIIDPEYHHSYLNVQNQEHNSYSLLWWMRQVIGVRKNYQAFGLGKMEILHSKNSKVFAFIRSFEEEHILVVVNLSRNSQFADFDLREFEGYRPRDLFSLNQFSSIGHESYEFTLSPYGYFWLLLEKERVDHDQLTKWTIPKLEEESTLDSLIYSSPFLQEILPSYLSTCRWYRTKSELIKSITVADVARFEGLLLTIFDVRLNNDREYRYFLPLATHPKGEQIEQAAIVAEWKGYFLIDAVYDQRLHEFMLQLILKDNEIKCDQGELIPNKQNVLNQWSQTPEHGWNSKVVSVEQSNSSINFDDRLFLKIFRSLENGINPDVELSKFLSAEKHFDAMPTYLGTLTYRQEKDKLASLGLLQEYKPNTGNVWGFALDRIQKYYEAIATDGDEETINDTSWRMLEVATQLGEKTAEMHLALNDYESESFTIFYQKSLYQSIRGQIKRAMKLLAKVKGRYEEPVREKMDEVIGLEKLLIDNLQFLLEEKIQAKKIRIHGDYHLGQVLYAGKELYIIDFEGEPAVPITERRLKRSPIQDIAGMVRSFHYASVMGLQNFLERYPAEDRDFFAKHGIAWYQKISSEFLERYTRAIHEKREEALIPDHPIHLDALFRAFMIHKVCYEIGYEIQNRPDWVYIPLTGILDLVGGVKESKELKT